MSSASSEGKLDQTLVEPLLEREREREREREEHCSERGIKRRNG